MSTKELIAAVDAIPCPDFHVRSRDGVFHVQALSMAGRDFLIDNLEDVSGSELIGGARLDREAALFLIDGMFDAGMGIV